MTNEGSWSYSSGKVETKEFAITDKYSFVQGPNSSYTISVIGTEYKIDVPYKAVYRSRLNGRIVKLEGKWTGITVTDTKVILKDNLGNVKETRSVTAKPTK